jgi:hypothetical protein
MSWSDYMKEEGWREYAMQDLIYVDVPDGKEKDELIRRIADAVSQEEAFDVAKKAKDFWGEKDSTDSSDNGEVS